LAEELEWAPSDVLAVLTEMEVADKVRSGPDGYSLT
jgi:predicted Rossmann fold nucleotide-binding protein DprA/Smf involved in DNA uptake